MSFISQGKTNWKFLLIVIVLAVITGGGILWCQKTSEQLYPLPETKEFEKVVEDETVEVGPSEVEEWQTYRHEEYGFKVNYPLWVEILETRLPIDKSALQLLGLIIPCYSPLQEVERNCVSVKVIRGNEMCQLGEKFLVIELAENPSQLPIKEWVWQNVIEKTEFFGEQEYNAYRDVGPPRDVRLGGKEGIIISFGIKFKAGSCEVIYLPKNSKVYIIGVCIYEAFLGSCSMYPNSDDILSTFRFLE